MSRPFIDKPKAGTLRYRLPRSVDEADALYDHAEEALGCPLADIDLRAGKHPEHGDIIVARAKMTTEADA